MKRTFAAALLSLITIVAWAQEYRTVTDIAYTEKTDNYAREQELFGRYDENQYLARMMKLVGHKQTYLYEIGGHDHGAMVSPSFHILESHLQQAMKESE